MNPDKELLSAFLEKAAQHVSESQQVLEALSSPEQFSELSAISDHLNQIMAGALALNLTQVGEMAKLGIEIISKMGAFQDINQLLSVQSVLAQMVKEVERTLKSIKKGNFGPTDEADSLIKKLISINSTLNSLSDHQ